MYAAVPSPTIDWALADGAGIPIEERDPEEMLGGTGNDQTGPSRTAVFNPGFDVTPARLLTGIITERGICQPSALRTLFLGTRLIR